MNIIYFSPVAYNGLKQRPQHIAEELAKQHRVYYIDPTIRLTSCILHGGKDYVGKREDISENLTVIRCNGTFVLPFRWNVYDFLRLNGMWERHQLKRLLNIADAIIVGYEGWMNVLHHITGKTIIYDKMDDNVLLCGSRKIGKYLKWAEQSLLKKTDVMLVTAECFLDIYKHKVKKVFLVPNGVEYCLGKNKQILKKSINGKIVFGYVGMISDWFDMEAIKTITSMRNIKVVLVGPCEINKIESENVVYTGRIPKEDVGKMIESFDVCLYPFKQNELLDSINPVKIYEYLAKNKPVIAVDSREIRRFGNLVYRYSNLKELRQICENRLEQPFQTEEECVRFIQENSWQCRVQQINKILEEL